VVIPYSGRGRLPHRPWVLPAHCPIFLRSVGRYALPEGFVSHVPLAPLGGA